MKPMFSYVGETPDGKFKVYRREVLIGKFYAMDVTEQFIKWVVDTLNENYEKFSVERSDKLLKEMGF